MYTKVHQLISDKFIKIVKNVFFYNWIYSDYNTLNDFKKYNTLGCTGRVLTDVQGVYTAGTFDGGDLMCNTVITPGIIFDYTGIEYGI